MQRCKNESIRHMQVKRGTLAYCYTELIERKSESAFSKNHNFTVIISVWNIRYDSLIVKETEKPKFSWKGKICNFRECLPIPILVQCTEDPECDQRCQESIKMHTRSTLRKVSKTLAKQRPETEQSYSTKWGSNKVWRIERLGVRFLESEQQTKFVSRETIPCIYKTMATCWNLRQCSMQYNSIKSVKANRKLHTLYSVTLQYYTSTVCCVYRPLHLRSLRKVLRGGRCKMSAG